MLQAATGLLPTAERGSAANHRQNIAIWIAPDEHSRRGHLGIRHGIAMCAGIVIGPGIFKNIPK